MDLLAAQDGRIKPGDRQIVPVTLASALDPTRFSYAIPRVPLVAKHGVTVLGSPQRMDPANPRVILFNSSTETFRYKVGHPLAELILSDLQGAA